MHIFWLRLLFIVSSIAIVCSFSVSYAQWFDCTSVTDVSVQECEAVVSLYEWLQWSQRTQSTWRLVDTTLGNRSGIGVENRNWQAHITSVHLWDAGLIGQVPAVLGELWKLEILDISYNSVTWLPTSIGDLNELILLDISNTWISSLPETIGMVSSLSVLNIGGSLVETLPDMSGLTELDQFICAYSDLTILPASLMELEDLDSIDCRWSDVELIEWTISTISSLLLTSTAITSLWPIALPKIITLQADKTPLSSTDIIGNMNSLDRLDLGETSLVSIDHLLNQMPSLQYLYIDKSWLTELWDLSLLSVLKDLRFNTNSLTQFPSWIDQLTQLVSLYAWNNAIIWEIPEAWSTLLNTKYVYLSNNALDRDADHAASKSEVLTTWAQTMWYNYNDGNQSDTTAPSVEVVSPVPFFLTWTTFSVNLNIQENSYLVDESWVWLSLSWSGGWACETLADTQVQTNGLVTIDYTIQAWIYENCELVLTDHDDNTTVHSVESRVVGDSYSDLCLHSDLTVSINECEALIAFYYQTQWDTRYTNNGWFQSTDIDTWHWVDVDAGHVVGLYLQKTSQTDGHWSSTSWNGNNLQWELPEVLFELSYLKHLNLSSNRISWWLDGDWSALSSLETLIINGNYLSNTIPDEFGDLSALKILQLRDNNLTWSIPESLSSLSSLEVLDLRENEISWELWIWIWWLFSLRYLNLTDNKLEWLLPESISNLWDLEVLYLGGNSFVGDIPESWSWLSTTRFKINTNALIRNLAKDAIMSSAILQWYQGHTIRERWWQDDLTASILSWVIQQFDRKQNETFQFNFEVLEESYVLDQYDEWMRVFFLWSELCESLTATLVDTGLWETSIVITVEWNWWYEWCKMNVEDHGDNFSNSIILPDFVSSQWPETVCYDPWLTTDREVCLSLVTLYQSTDPEKWNDSTERWINPVVQDRYGVDGDIVDRTVTSIVLSDNSLSWSVVLDLDTLIHLETIDLSSNIIPEVSLIVSQEHWLQELRLQWSQVTSSLLPSLEYLVNLKYLDLSKNSIVDEFPWAIIELSTIEVVDLHDNLLIGNLDTELWWLILLEKLNVSWNMIHWALPEILITLENLEYLDVSDNAIDHDVLYDAILPTQRSWFANQLVLYAWWAQQDTTPVVLTSLSHSQIIEWVLVLTLWVQEWSYVVDATWAWMSIDILWPWLCNSITSLDTIGRSSWTWMLWLSILIESVYEDCRLRVTDHSGNQSEVLLNNFESSFRCGNGQIDIWEVCDEWRSCEDGRDCTADPTICASECEVRLVDNCTPSCSLSACWDGVTDSEWVDNIPWTYDDEQCDSGSSCVSTWESCSTNSAVCPEWVAECQVKQTLSCTPSCSYWGCGDGFVDLDGLDGLLETDDDEWCDLWDLVDGDGCSSSCQLEFCGDGLTDPDGPDNNAASLWDNEECDEWPHNGVLWWICTSSCQQPEKECLYCYEVCDGWESDNTIFLLLDTSWSMGDNNKLQKAKEGAIEFIDLIEDRASSNTWFVSKIGIIEYRTQASMAVAPTQDYDSLRNAITNFYAGWSTNIGWALDVAYDYFQNNSLTESSHVVLLSDGEPTIWTNYLSPVSWAYDRAQALKNIWVEVYTISLELSFEWIDIMRTVSSSQIQNIALGKSATQSSTSYRWNDWKSAWKAVDNSLNNNYSIAQTKNRYQSYWDLDLWSQYEINQLKLWNRTWSHAWKTKNYHVMVRSSPFTSTDLQTMLNDSQTWSMHTSGQAWRPTRYDLEWEWRYVRIQQEWSNHFTINELEILWCTTWESCYDVFSYEDYQWDAVDLIFSHIFWSIHCDCKPEQVCGLCGDGETYEAYGEECDLWSVCSDGSSCTGDDSSCSGVCSVVSSQECTSQCRAPVCGDTLVTSPNTDDVLEQCDNGKHCANNSPCTFDSQCNSIGDGLCRARDGDGCSELCQQESCGDRIVDFNGADNLWDTNDDEQCDDGSNNGIDERCMLNCSWNPTLVWDPWSCGITNPLYQIAWNGTLIDQSTLWLCTSGTPIDFEYYPALHSRWRICQWVQWADDQQCELSEWYCGDKTIDSDAGEQCDDGNQADGDGCSATCIHEPVASSYDILWTHCHENQQPLIVQTNEIVPLTWSVDLVSGIDENATGCVDLEVGKFIPWWSLVCELLKPSWEVVSVACLEYTSGSSKLFADVLNDYERTSELSIGGTIMNPQLVWRQRFVLQNISYTHCDTSRTWQVREHRMVQPWEVCTMPVGVVEWYRIDKWATLSSSTQKSMSLLDETWEELLTSDTVSSVQKIQSTSDFKSLIAIFMETFIGSNRWSSVMPAFPWWADQSTKKSFTKRVHFFRGTQTRKAITLDTHFLSDPEKPFSLVVENADLIIDGSLKWNGMYVVDGGVVRFETKNCDMTDVVEWIFVTDRWFETENTLNTDPYAQQRCKGWNLVINWLLMGPWIDAKFVSSRRSQLDIRWLEQQDAVGQIQTSQQKKAVTRKQWNRITEWPSVRIDTSPLARSKLPPWVRELFEAIAVWR